MSVVSVSKESLQRVKTALREFQTNVETSTEHIKSHAEEIVTSMRSSIKKQQALVESLENKVALLSSEIEQCQAQIICNSNQINSLKDNIADVSSRVSSLDGRIVQLDMQKQRLSASSSSADHCNDNSNQIYAIEHQIQSCENQRRQLDNQLSSMRNQENSLNCQNAKLHAEKSRMDATLIMTKKELKEACEKSEEMKSAGAAVESSISNFLNVAQQFRQTAIFTSNTNKSGIEKCIVAIDEYLMLSLISDTQAMNSSLIPSRSDMQSESESNGGHRCRYTNLDDIPEDVFNQAKHYQENHQEKYNLIIRNGETSHEIEAFRATINRHQLLEDTHFVRRATLADLGELSSIPVNELPGRSYPFVGIMSASNSANLGIGTVVYEISAPEGMPALDLTSVGYFNEVMFDSPQCHIERVEPMGYNTTCIFISIRPN